MINSLKLPDGKIDPIRMGFFLFCIAVIFLTCMFIYMRWFEDNPPLVLFFQNEEEKLIIDKSVYVPGETMAVHFEFCKYTDAQLTIYKTWRDSIIYLEDPQPGGGAEKGECGEVDLPVVVPNLPAGEYTLHFKLEYEINVFRTRSLEYDTESFLIGQ